MINRKYLYFVVIAGLFGFIHGYLITFIKNKERIEEAYKLVNNNYSYQLSEVRKKINEEGLDSAKLYVDGLIDRNEQDYKYFCSKNPRYIPLMERENENVN